MLLVCASIISMVMGTSGNLGLETGKSRISLTGVLSESLPASMSVIMAVATNDFEIEAIRNMLSLDRGVHDWMLQ